MGVPALFRWLTQKYPKITTQVIEELPQVVDGTEIPVDITLPNPNEIEFDNLYLDMNGIIHPCCHPEDKPAPETEDEMYVEIFKYIDRIVGMIRPRKLLYMAIDGVAPRAKMNQQRSRRFRAARDEQLKFEKEEEIRAQWTGDPNITLEQSSKSRFDSNCITPGTPFMQRLAVCLRYYIADKLNNDPGWKNIKVILSDASVPGEGEHKVMDFIRRQKNQTTYDVNTKHILYGLDADLIMLALATHEPNFWILREDVTVKDGKQRACAICGQTDHQAAFCTGKKKEIVGKYDDQSTYLSQKPFTFLHISILREYLEIDLRVSTNFDWNLERAVDDWVFMIFFVGNDFLPHLPSLEIREGAIETLIDLWKRSLNNWGDYITHSGDISIQKVQYLMHELGKIEDEAFQKRRQEEENRRIARLRRKKEARATQQEKEALKRKIDESQNYYVQAQQFEFFEAKSGKRQEKPVVSGDNTAAAKRLKLLLQNKVVAEPAVVKKEEEVEEVMEGGSVAPKEEAEASTSELEAVDSDEEAPKDDVRLWESGWKTRYYEQKFQVDLGDHKFRRAVVTSYIEGLCWVLKYYYQGVPSWQWFYPYHYSPFASDFELIDQISITFDLGKPFKPIEQLMGVLPAASRSHIPSIFHSLMMDEDSEVIDFYPTDFPIDLNGKKHEWQGVAILPFIDANRLLKAMKPLYDKLSATEQKRNSRGEEILCFGSKCPLFDELLIFYGHQKPPNPVPIDPLKCSGIAGFVSPDPEVCIPGTTFSSPLGNLGLPDISNVQFISFNYVMPKFPDGYKFRARLLPGVKAPPNVLDENDRYNVKTGFYSQRGRRRNFGGTSRNTYGSPYNQRPANRQAHENFSNRSERPREAYNPQQETLEPYMGGGGYAGRNQYGQRIQYRNEAEDSRSGNRFQSNNSNSQKFTTGSRERNFNREGANRGYSHTSNDRRGQHTYFQDRNSSGGERSRNDTRNYGGYQSHSFRPSGRNMTHQNQYEYNNQMQSYRGGYQGQPQNQVQPPQNSTVMDLLSQLPGGSQHLYQSNQNLRQNNPRRNDQRR